MVFNRPPFDIYAKPSDCWNYSKEKNERVFIVGNPTQTPLDVKEYICDYKEALKKKGRRRKTVQRLLPLSLSI